MYITQKTRSAGELDSEKIQTCGPMLPRTTLISLCIYLEEIIKIHIHPNVSCNVQVSFLSLSQLFLCLNPASRICSYNLPNTQKCHICQQKKCWTYVFVEEKSRWLRCWWTGRDDGWSKKPIKTKRPWIFLILDPPSTSNRYGEQIIIGRLFVLRSWNVVSKEFVLAYQQVKKFRDAIVWSFIQC